MNMQHKRSHHPSMVVAGYVRCSGQRQCDQYGINVQKRALAAEAAQRGFPTPVFYEEKEQSARSEHMGKRPTFQRGLQDVEAGRVQVVMMYALDRWSRSARGRRQSLCTLAEHQATFILLSEHEREGQA
jgi:DNA invertase Pin-like site-specific DNA recombinase